MDSNRTNTSEPLSKLIQSQIPNSSKSNETDLPELDAEETAAVILAGRKAKEYELKRIEYGKKVRSEHVPIKFTPDQFGEFVRERFKASNGYEFEVNESNSEIFYALCDYFTDNESHMDPKKGIMLCGNVGVGKTEMMKLFTTNPYASYGIIGCRMVADGFSFTTKDENPEDHIKLYSNVRKAAKPHPYNHETLGLCFDDLGTETIPAMNYGNSKNVMAEVIMNRYDNRLPFYQTHITTNLMPDKIKELYGSRFLDRITQMFNQVVFTQIESRRI